MDITGFLDGQEALRPFNIGSPSEYYDTLSDAAENAPEFADKALQRARQLKQSAGDMGQNAQDFIRRAKALPGDIIEAGGNAANNIFYSGQTVGRNLGQGARSAASIPGQIYDAGNEFGQGAVEKGRSVLDAGNNFVQRAKALPGEVIDGGVDQARSLNQQARHLMQRGNTIPRDLTLGTQDRIRDVIDRVSGKPGEVIDVPSSLGMDPAYLAERQAKANLNLEKQQRSIDNRMYGAGERFDLFHQNQAAKKAAKAAAETQGYADSWADLNSRANQMSASDSAGMDRRNMLHKLGIGGELAVGGGLIALGGNALNNSVRAGRQYASNDEAVKASNELFRREALRAAAAGGGIGAAGVGAYNLNQGE